MNAVEIEQAITELASQPFDAAEFPYAFLEAFGNKATTIKRLRSGATNRSDLGGVLQRNHIHILVAEPGAVAEALTALRTSAATKAAKARFILATDGVVFEAEDLTSGETVACAYEEFPDHFGFFFALAGISTIRQIRENTFDIRATSRLNRLYVELLKDNPDWGEAERRSDMNKFMARLIFCFFAEDTDIFVGRGRFTETIARMSAPDASNTHEIISTLFRAMNTEHKEREAAKIPRWANEFPYVNGRLFSGSDEVPRFSKVARSYLIHVGNLDWTKINPDIFGSMIQAVADDEERSHLGMHYTSVPNILKVLNPLFLDDLRAKLEEAGENPRKLLNLRKRMAKIRVFDPACGSGNFLVIAYKEMRAIESVINSRRGEPNRRSDIPLTNFRGIELRDFPAEIARLALIIAEYQCDVLYRGEKLALAEFLPLKNENWIVCGNALRLDWLSICPPTGKDVSVHSDDLFSSAAEDQAEVDFENEGGETYICGNPPYLGSRAQTHEQKRDIRNAISAYTTKFASLDYVSGWFVKAAEYALSTKCSTAFVSTNSICQGQQVSVLWPIIHHLGSDIFFAYTSFRWQNLASHNAAVTVVIIGLSNFERSPKKIYVTDDTGVLVSEVSNINSYLVASPNVFVAQRSSQISGLMGLDRGSAPTDDGAFFVKASDLEAWRSTSERAANSLYRAVGGDEFINGKMRWIVRISDEDLEDEGFRNLASPIIESVRKFRKESKKVATRRFADRAHLFTEDRHMCNAKIFVPQLMSDRREYLTCGLLSERELVLAPHFQAPRDDVFNIALISSRVHLIWVDAVCGKLETRYRYSNKLGWNTFPVPFLTEKNKADLTRCAEAILFARERHFPATIAELYEPNAMPADLREAHDRNDEVVERIYIGRRFKNDTERLEKLFELYTKMTSEEGEQKAKQAMSAPAATRAKKKAQA